ncbi:hypothetical protein [uncultured Desulfosarcina sp.]|uniref:hypothetical protein n=1 Tax=uncultured Desulfosarcina sp. TaxID=218289 RepID=UPI0029C8926D|nr:hypothetical protein [uncultured Desulfosarcina sp.]
MKPKPTGIRMSLLAGIVTAALACSNPMPSTVSTGSTESEASSSSRPVAEAADHCKKTMAPPAIGRVWVERDGRVVGFFFATPGCDLCENRNGTVAVFLDPTDETAPIKGESAPNDTPAAAIVLPKEEESADSPFIY